MVASQKMDTQNLEPSAESMEDNDSKTLPDIHWTANKMKGFYRERDTSIQFSTDRNLQLIR